MAYDLIIIAAFFSCFFGYMLAESNPLNFDKLEGHVVLSVIASVGCSIAAAAMYVLCL